MSETTMILSTGAGLGGIAFVWWYKIRKRPDGKK